MKMYTKGKGSAVTSDAQAREKLALYVYEYLLHVGAQKAAQLFLSEIRWDKAITLGEPPGFLHSWWCVFWDLYCAAPERRDSCEHSGEAKAFHDYGFVNSGYLNGMSHNPNVPSPMSLPPQDPNLPPGPAPGFFPGSMPVPGSDVRQPGPMPMQRMPCPRLPIGYVQPPRPGPPPPQSGPGTPGLLTSLPGSQLPPSRPNWIPPNPQYSSASPVTFNGPPPPSSGTPGIMQSPQSLPQEPGIIGPEGTYLSPLQGLPPRQVPAGVQLGHTGGAFTVQHGAPPPHHDSVVTSVAVSGLGGVLPPVTSCDMMPPGGGQPLPPHLLSNGIVDGSSPHLQPGQTLLGQPGTPRDDMGGVPPPPPPVSVEFSSLMMAPQFSESGLLPPMSGPPMPPGPPQHLLGDQAESAAILKIKESMQEEAKRFEKDMVTVDGVDANFYMQQ